MIRCTSAASSASGTSTSIPRAPIRAGYSSSEDIVYRVPSRPTRVAPAAWAASATASTTCTTGAPALATSSYNRCIVLAQMPSTVAPAFTRAVDDWIALGRRYATEATALVKAGATVLGICANTMHLLYDDVASAGVPVVHVVDAVADAAQAAGATRVGLLGTRYTMSSEELYPARMGARGIDVLVPEADDAAEVHRIIYSELVLGQVLEPSRDALRDVVGRLVERGAQAVVLGCTELGMIVGPEQSAVRPSTTAC